jgi:hypothetical protein
VHEEILCEVLRILAAMPAPADEGVNRIAIKAIKFLEGSAGFRSAFSRGSGHDQPMSRVEFRPPASRRVKWCVQSK